MAPSPTGSLHIGTAQAAIFNWLFARHNQGTFVLRIEDTDRARSEDRFEEDIVNSLRWLGLDWDEFYRQNDRTPIYSKYIQNLLEEGKAFWCYHTPEELEAEGKEQITNKQVPRHVCSFKIAKPSKTKPKAKSAKEESAPAEAASGVIRLAVDENSTRKISFKDIIRGTIEFEERLLGDFSIAKAADQPLYHLAVVVDDYEMNISHIIRGEDHIANTPKHILIQEALGFDMPTYAHLPLILAPDKSKLSKRHGATSVDDYKKQGYLPEAMFNYLALLGFTAPGDQELLNKDQLIDVFDLAKVHKSGAVFDLKKLDWVNSEYIKKMPDSILQPRITEYFEHEYGSIDPEYIARILPLVRERIKKFGDIHEFNYFFAEPEIDATLIIWKTRTPDEVASALARVAKLIEQADLEDKLSLRSTLDALGAELNDRGLVYWPLRVALSGQKASPDPIDIASVLGKTKVIARINTAIKVLI